MGRALIGTLESWSPQQIKEFQQYWDALLEGNLAQRRHAKFVPGGVAKTFIPTRDAELKGAYDEWLARVVCFAFSISPQPFVAQVNRATAETAHEAALAEGLAPIQTWVKQLECFPRGVAPYRLDRRSDGGSRAHPRERRAAENRHRGAAWPGTTSTGG